jgi:hypothetical protein
MDTVLAAVVAVAAGHEATLLLRSSAGRRRWVQLTHVVGKEARLGETVSDEYLDRFHQLPAPAPSRLRSLSWRGGSEGSFTQWADVATEEEREELARFLLRTLVEALGHNPGRAPSVSRP